MVINKEKAQQPAAISIGRLALPYVNLCNMGAIIDHVMPMMVSQGICFQDRLWFKKKGNGVTNAARKYDLQ